MGIFLIVGIIIAAVAVGYVIGSEANNGLVGTVVGIIAGLLIILGLASFADEIKSIARVDMAAAMCVADVQQTENWVGMSIPALSEAAEANVVTDVLSADERTEAASDCFEQLKEVATASVN